MAVIFRAGLARLSFVAASLMLVSAIPSQAQTTLRWKFQPGETYTQAVEQEMKMAMKLGQQDITTTMSQTIDATWKVTEVDNEGKARIDQQFTRIRMSMQSPGGIGFDFDSNQDKKLTGVGAAIEPALRALAEASFSLSISPQGVIDDVEVSQATTEAFQSLPGAGNVGDMFSKDGLVHMIKQGSVPFPAEALRPGASWTSDSEMKLPQIGTMQAKHKLVYEGPEEVDGKTLQKINVDVETKIAPGEGAGAKITLKDQESTGVMYFDSAAGRLDHSRLVQTLTLNVAIAGNEFDQKIDQTVKVRLRPAQR